MLGSENIENVHSLFAGQRLVLATEIELGLPTGSRFLVDKFAHVFF